jgi:hypothetical protein
MDKNYYKILLNSGSTYNIPVWLDNTIDEMGVMVGFDGNIGIENHLCDFTYITTTGSTTIEVFNTADPSVLRSITEAIFTVNWGDGNMSDLPVSVSNTLSSTTHTYSGSGIYTVSISLNSPWSNQVIEKTLPIPVPDDVFNKPNPLGTFTGLTIPAYVNLTGQTQNYLNDLNYTNNTGYTTFNFMALGRSRVDEFQLYGGGYSGITTGTTDSGTTIYTAYTIDNLQYFDYPDGITQITGTTSDFYMESVFNNMITRNEHFIGFIDDPIIYSDVFIKRGQQSVLETTLRLSEIDNNGLLEIYGNGYYNIQKQ